MIKNKLYCDACNKESAINSKEYSKSRFNIKIEIDENKFAEFTGAELCDDCKDKLQKKDNVSIVDKRLLNW